MSRDKVVCVIVNPLSCNSFNNLPWLLGECVLTNSCIIANLRFLVIILYKYAKFACKIIQNFIISYRFLQYFYKKSEIHIKFLIVILNVNSIFL